MLPQGPARDNGGGGGGVCVVKVIGVVVVASASQVCALLYYLFGDTPGGIAGVKFLGRVIVKTFRLILSPCIAALNGD